MKKAFFPLITIIILALGACARVRPPLVSRVNPDKATIQLAEAATSISRSLQQLAHIQAVATPPVRKDLPNPSTFGFDAIATIDWSGPIEPLVRKIARTVGYQVHVMGPEPAIPVIITLSAKNTPMGYILRDVDFQGGNRAHLVVNRGHKIIELRYAKA